MTFLDLFAGIGGFRKGMELAGHKCVGFCEYDKYAVASYTSMHLLTDKQREYLQTLSKKERQKEILKEEYRNGEWYVKDIREITGENIPKTDCWCFGAPCQDFSVAGSMAGLKGNRSSLVKEIFRILGEIPEEDRPRWLIYENVKGMLSSNKGFDFLAILLEMDRWGYDVQWQLLNSKYHGVPQNRERVYLIGHLRRFSSAEIFPIKRTGRTDSVCTINNDNLRKPKININNKCIVVGNTNPSGKGMNGYCYYSNGINPSVTCNKSEGNRIAIPVLTPERVNKRQNGRRFKENGEEAFTLTAQDRHGVAIRAKDVVANKEISSDLTLYAVWYPKEECYIVIRKLTPKECFRLQGWSDDYFDKAHFVNSDSQLYKQAGNGVTVTVVYDIVKRL